MPDAAKVTLKVAEMTAGTCSPTQKPMLPSFKVPRSLDFVTDLPRSAAGKIQRNKVRAPYWEGRAKQI